MVWAFIGAFDEALAASGADTEKEMWLLKLYEASLMFTVRVRQQLSPLQITLDNLSSADFLRTRCIAERTLSYWTFACELGEIEEVNAKDSGRAVLKTLNTLNISYKGKAVDLNQVYAILGILTYQCPKIESAVNSLETIAPSIFSEFTKIGRLCQTYKK
jgi:hypothetical protein